jgi:hypothetical protein
MNRSHLLSAFMERLQQVREEGILALILAAACVCDIAAAWLIFVK